jgi:anti-sigma factor RsiW
MKCKQAQPDLLEYSRDLLTPADSGRIREHLESCAACRAELEAEKKMAESLSSVPVLAPTSDVWQQVVTRVRQERRPLLVFNFSLGRHARRMAAAAAAFVVLMVAVLVSAPWQWQHASSEKESIRQAAALMQVQPVAQPTDDQLTRTNDDMMKVIEGEL